MRKYWKRYSRKAYPSRGCVKYRDFIWEGLHSGECVICGASLIRKKYNNGVTEAWGRFLKRKTCGNYYDENGNSQLTDCLRAWRAIPENNGHFKGIMPKCIDCGKKISYTMGGKAIRCKKCFDDYGHKSGYYAKRAKEVLGEYTFKKGVMSSPKPFVKGNKSWNKNKPYKQVYGEEKSKRLRNKLSEDRKKYWELGMYDRVKKEKIEWACKVCGKKQKLSPYYAKTKKVCSHACAGKMNGKIKQICV